jgi:hypothetical protein
LPQLLERRPASATFDFIQQSNNGCRHEHARQETSGQNTTSTLLTDGTHTIRAKRLFGKLIDGRTTRSSLASNAAATILAHPPHTLRGYLILLKQCQYQPKHTAYSAIHLCKQRSPVDLFAQHFNNQPDIIRRPHAKAKGYCLVRPCPA